MSWLDTPNLCPVCLHATSYCRGRSNRQAGTVEIIMKPGFEHAVRVPCCFRERLNNFLTANKWLVVKCLRGYKYDLFVHKTDTESIICGPYWMQFLACYGVQPDDKLELFFDPEDLEVPGEYELEFTDYANEPKKWAIQSEQNQLVLKGGCEEPVDVAPRATSRYCLSYFLQVIKSLRDSQRKSMLVAEIRFGEIIHLDDCIVPRSFAQWLADACTFGDDGSIIIQNAVILNHDSVQDTFAIPSGSASCAIEEEEGKLAFLAQFALSDVPSLKYFGNMVMNDELPADVFKHAFMTVALGTFLCPTSSTKPSTKYLGALVDVECINDLNWCKIVHDWLLCYLKKYHKDKMKGNKVSITLVKNISETCYIAKSYIESSSHVNGNLSDRINSVIGNFIPQKVKNDICNCVQTHLIGESDHTCFKVEAVVLDVLRCITTGDFLSGDTLKLNSSHEIISPDNVNDRNTTENVLTRSNENELHGQGMKRSLNNMMSNEHAVAPTSSAASQSNKRPKLNKSSSASRIFRCRRLDLNETPVEDSPGPHVSSEWLLTPRSPELENSEYFLEKWPNKYMRKIWQANVVKGFQGADSARKLHLSERLHFPSLYDRHWFLFSVDLKARKFLFMDSLLGEASELHTKVDARMIKNFIQTWDECNLKNMHFETFGKMNDCGIFLIKYMEKFCTRNPQSCSFSAKDIPVFHLQIAINTLFNEYNSAHDYMEFIRSFDIEEYKRNGNNKHNTEIV
ncbi:hypothetical protein ACQ4PT_021793 [Festuca glaucescens]